MLAFEPMAPNIGALRRTLCENPGLQERLTLITLVGLAAPLAAPIARGLPAWPAGCRPLVLSAGLPLMHACPPPPPGNAAMQGLSDRKDRCKFYVYTGNIGNGIAACEGEPNAQ